MARCDLRHVLSALAAASLLLAGCQPSEGRTNGDGTEHASSRETLDGDQLIAAAQRRAAQYDYDAALDLVDDLDSGPASETAQRITQQREEAVVWEDNATIPHLFIHSLIVDPDRAFASEASGEGYADYMVTLEEFTELLAELYARDYVLVSPHDIASINQDGDMAYTNIALPEGKKPVVLSQDDVNYYEYMSGDGFADDLFINDDGEVVNHYTDADGTTHEGAYDVVPVIDEFIREHPDFSYRGAKGVLALTGYNGVLGYRTSPETYGEDEQLEAERDRAREVAEELKEDGWEFASHSWGHVDLGSMPWEDFTSDTDLWEQEVQPIVGETDLLIYPFGADIAGIEPYGGERFDFLKEKGFDYFFNVDASVPSWHQLGDEYLREARINVDGLRMTMDLDGGEALAPFCDVAELIDDARPSTG